MGFEDFARAARGNGQPEPTPTSSGNGFADFARTVRGTPSPTPSFLGLTAGPVELSPEQSAMVRPPAPVTDSEIGSLGQMPYGFRFNLQMRRGDPAALTSYLKGKGFTIGEMDPAGRLIIKDKYGNKYDANEALMGQEAVTKGVPQGVQLGSALAGAFMGYPTAGVMAGSAAADAYSNLLDTAAGLPPKRSLEDIGTNAVAAGTIDKVLQYGIGGAARSASGLAGLRREGAAAAGGAEKAIAEKRGMAEFNQNIKLGEVRGKAQQDFEAIASGDPLSKATAAYENERTKQMEKALAEVKPDIMRTELANVFGVDEATISRAVPAKSLDELTQRVQPLRNTVKGAVARQFEELSGQFDEVLLPHAQVPITPTLIGDSANAFRSNIIGDKTISGPLKKLFERVDDMSGGGEEINPSVLRNIEKLRASGDVEGATNIARLHGADEGGVNVKQALDLRTDFQKLYRTSTSPLERSAARKMTEAIDETLAGVVPEADQARLGNLRANWGFASNLYDQTYRKGFREAENPAEVARILYDSSTSGGKLATGKIATVMNDINKNNPAAAPEVRAAFADNILSGDDPGKTLRSMNPQVFKSIFGIPQTPTQLADALESRIDMARAMQDPQHAAAIQTYFNKGMSSVGGQQKAQALANAQKNLQNVPDANALIERAMKKELTPSQAGDMAVAGMEKPADALVRGQKEGMKAPMFGSWTHYVKNRMTYQVGLSLAAGMGGYLSGYQVVGPAIALGFLGSSAAANYALSKPAIAEPYYKFLTSKTREQAAYYLGRVTAAELSSKSKN